MAESALPYPTPTRLRLADAIAAGHIRHYHWVNPQSIDTVRDVHVTARLAELVAAGLATFGEREDPVLSWSTAVLTPDGMAWVTRARTREEGPAVTSPAAGPDRDAVMVMGVLLASPNRDEPGMLLSAAEAYAALKSSRGRESGHSTEDGAADVR